MTLFDTDKNQLDRGKPRPNHSDQLNAGSVAAHGTNSVNYVTDSSDDEQVLGAKNGQFTIVKVDTITLTSSVSLASNPGAGTYANFRSVTIARVPHGLPFIPTVTGSVISSTGLTYGQMPHGDADYSSSTTSALWHNLKFAADATYIYVLASGMVWGGGWNLGAGWSFKYFAQYQTSN